VADFGQAASSRRDGDGREARLGDMLRRDKQVNSSKLGVKCQISNSKYLARLFIGGFFLEIRATVAKKDYVRNFQQKVRNEPNRKDRIQNAEYRRQNKKMSINVCLTKDCAVLFPANCLNCSHEVIIGHQETKPIYPLGNEPNPV
jgi:hypothetical protein